MSPSTRNIILVTAPSGGGKSHYIRELSQMLLDDQKTFSHITDADHIAEAVVWDHENHQGMNHIHPADIYSLFQYSNGGHEHLSEKPLIQNVFPFAVTSNVIRDQMFTTYWTQVLNAPTEGFVIAELAAGANVHPKESLNGKADYSYESMVAGFRNGIYPQEVLQRVLIAIHPETAYEVRLDRTIRQRDDSWKEVVDIFGVDDFDHLRRIMQLNGTHIVDIPNDEDKTPDRIKLELQQAVKDFIPFQREGYSPQMRK